MVEQITKMEIHLKRNEIAEHFLRQIPENISSEEEQEYLNAILMLVPMILGHRHKINQITKEAVHGLLDCYFGNFEDFIAERNKTE